MSFDDLCKKGELSLKSKEVKVKGATGKEYTFTVKELSPLELAKCLDEFQTIDIVALVYRSVRDQNGKRMSKEQAEMLDDETFATFLNAYNSFHETTEKKTKQKKKS